MAKNVMPEEGVLVTPSSFSSEYLLTLRSTYQRYNIDPSTATEEEHAFVVLMAGKVGQTS